MIKIKTEEAMGYRGKDMRQMLLLAGVGVLALALAGGISGCGSNDAQPQLSRQDKKPAATATARPQVKEVLPQGSPAAALPQARLLERTDPDSIEVLPPSVPGGRGITLAEVKAAAAAAKPVDPDLLEVLPPTVPGGRGITLSEAKAAAAAANPVDPDLLEVLPPTVPGGRGITLAEAKAAAAAAKPVDPNSIEALPPYPPETGANAKR